MDWFRTVIAERENLAIDWSIFGDAALDEGVLSSATKSPCGRV